MSISRDTTAGGVFNDLRNLAHRTGRRTDELLRASSRLCRSYAPSPIHLSSKRTPARRGIPVQEPGYELAGQDRGKG